MLTGGNEKIYGLARAFGARRIALRHYLTFTTPRQRSLRHRERYELVKVRLADSPRPVYARHGRTARKVQRQRVQAGVPGTSRDKHPAADLGRAREP